MKKMIHKISLGVLLAILGLLELEAQAPSANNLIVFDPPSEKFASVKLQAHMGLPRFGAFNSHKVKNTGATPAMRPARGNDGAHVIEQNKKERNGLLNFSILVGLKYLEPFMSDLDRERLTVVSSSISQEQRNSAYLQQFLRTQVGPNLCLDNACNQTNQGKNEFERLRNYTSFVEVCLEPLQRWGQSFFKNDEMVGYHVSTLHVGRGYDFDKLGYWVGHYLNLNDVFTPKQGGAKRVVFEPVAAYEHELLKKINGKNNLQFFLKIDEQSAERFLKEGINRLYLVKKIKLKRSGKSMAFPYDPVEFNYSHVDSDVEVYEDEALTKHFMTLSLANLILKTN